MDIRLLVVDVDGPKAKRFLEHKFNGKTDAWNELNGVFPRMYSCAFCRGERA